MRTEVTDKFRLVEQVKHYNLMMEHTCFSFIETAIDILPSQSGWTIMMLLGEILLSHWTVVKSRTNGDIKIHAHNQANDVTESEKPRKF